MIYLMRLSVASFTILVLGAGVCVAQTPVVPDRAQRSIRARVDRGDNVGIVVGIVNPHGETYYAYGATVYGGDQTPDEHTVFEIGSITKVFTSILLADMVNRGEVSLEDPIERYLPNSIEAPTRGGESITLEHLATHTSGLPRMANNMRPADFRNPYADYSVEQLYEFLDGYPLYRDIGAQYDYSNIGAGLLGHVLALKAGKTYEELVIERLVDVLDMQDTRIVLTPSMQDRLASGHVDTTVVSNWDVPTLAGAGALRSTARDMLVFLSANMGLVESDLLSAMRTTHEVRHEAGSSIIQIGLGWHIRVREGHNIIWHNGGTGGYRSFAGFVRETQTGVVVLTNSVSGADDIGMHLLDPRIGLRAVGGSMDLGQAVEMIGPRFP